MPIDAQRILARCDELAKYSELPGGLTRVFLSPEMRQADEAVLGWMREAGMSARLDEMANCVGRYEGQRPSLPCLMLGSHLDTVPNAGRYDGMLGVVTAIECVAGLNERGVRLPFAIEIIGFSDEEGVRYGATLLGSRAIAGTFELSLLDKQDAAGTNMRDALRGFGLDPERIANARRESSDVHAYVELHIEQGPVLEAENLPVGVVAAINGANRFIVTVTGSAGHAGTVPMNSRRDALTASAECILAVEKIATAMAHVVGTVGKIEAFPGADNVIPGIVTFTLDVRAPTDELRLKAITDMRDEFQAVASRRSVGVVLTPIYEAATAVCSFAIQEQLATAIESEGFSVRRLPSGAGHDGLAMVSLTPIGMLFVKCKGGIRIIPPWQ